MAKSKEIKLNLPAGKNRTLFFVLIVFIGILMLFFNQFYDMAITTWHSHDLLDLIGMGKGNLFYKAVFAKASAGGYYANGASMDAAFYNPVIYIVIAILILPLYVIGKIMNTAVNPDNYCEYMRLIMIGVAVATAVGVRNIHDKFSNESKNKDFVSVPLLFMSSPILIIAVVVANQVDIAATLLLVYAFAAYLDNRDIRFAVLIAISALIKPFTLLAFIPLLLLKEKRIKNIIFLMAIGVLPLGVISVVSRLLPGYTDTQSAITGTYSFSDRIFSSTISGGMGEISLFVVGYIAVCAVAFIINCDKNRLYRVALVLNLIAYFVFYIFVEFHIQWIIYIMPFVVLSIMSACDKEKAILMDIGMEASFVLTVGIIHSMESHMRNSIIGRIPAVIDVEFGKLDFARRLFDNTDIAFSFMVAFAIAFVAVLIWEILNDKKEPQSLNYPLVYLRMASILIYALPPIICLFFEIL